VEAARDSFPNPDARPARAPAATRTDARFQPRILTTITHRTVHTKRLMDDMAGSKDLPSLTNKVEAQVLAGGSLLSLIESSPDINCVAAYLLASDLAQERRGQDPALSRQLEMQLAELMAVHGETITAALNSAKAISDFQGSVEDRKWIRAAYVGAVVNQSTASDLFESLIVRFGVQKFEQGALTILQALNDDLNAGAPSVRPNKLHILLLSSLVALRHLLAFIHATSEFLEKYNPTTFTRPSKTKGSKERKKGKQDSSQDSEAGKSPKKEDDRETDSASKLKSSLELLDVESADLASRFIRILLQLINGQGAVKVVHRFIDEELAKNCSTSTVRLMHSDLVAFVQSLPLTLWRERGHKDKLIDALRKQAVSTLHYQKITPRCVFLFKSTQLPNGCSAHSKAGPTF
jgi:type III secretion system YopN/LcrE/InvE/MxiC family regulator